MREVKFNVAKIKNIGTGATKDIPAIKGEGINYDAEIDQLATEVEELAGTVDDLSTSTKEDLLQLDNSKLTKPTDGIAVGKYFRVASIDELGNPVLEAVDLPIATTTTVGLLKGETAYGFGITSSGQPRTYVRTQEQYDSASSYMFLGKGTLENIKESLVKSVVDKPSENVINEVTSEALNVLDIDFKTVFRTVSILITIPTSGKIETDGSPIRIVSESGDYDNVLYNSFTIDASTRYIHLFMRGTVVNGVFFVDRAVAGATGTSTATPNIGLESQSTAYNGGFFNKNIVGFSKLRIPCKSGSSFPIGTKIWVKGVVA